MANVVRVHINGFTYTHATATAIDDAAVAVLTRRIAGDQLVNPQPPIPVEVKTDVGTCSLMVFPHRVWAFALSVAPATTTGGTGGTGVSIGVNL